MDPRIRTQSLGCSWPEVGEGEKQDEEDEADGEWDEQGEVIDRGVEERVQPPLTPLLLPAGRVHRRQLLVAQVTGHAARDRPDVSYGNV